VIAAALVSLTAEYPDRFAMRFSNAPIGMGLLTTVSIEHPHQQPLDVIICPAQTDGLLLFLRTLLGVAQEDRVPSTLRGGSGG
jgi:hypothetical protein